MKKIMTLLMTLLLTVGIVTTNVNKVDAAEFITKVEIDGLVTDKLNPAYKYYEFLNDLSWMREATNNEKYSIHNINLRAYSDSSYQYSSFLYQCDLSPRNQEYVDPNLYYQLRVEVFANPVGNGVENPDYDYDVENIGDLEIWINGEKTTMTVPTSDYNKSWRGVILYIPLTVDLTPMVTNIAITNEDTSVEKGSSLPMLANISYYGAGYDEIIWSVSGNASSSTTISNTGVLTVGNDETASKVTVTATAAKDSSVSASKTLNVLDKLTVDSVSITGDLDGITKGYQGSFKGVVEGTAPHNVSWELSHYTSLNTKLIYDGNNCTVYVGEDESYDYVEVKAISNFDPEKTALVQVPVRNIEYIKEIKLVNVNFDVSSEEMTYGQLGIQLKSATVQDSSKTAYDNVFIRKYDNPEHTGESVQVYPTGGLANDYTNVPVDFDGYYTVNYQFFAKPYGQNSTNPQYDFDKANLSDIAVYVNGEKSDVVPKNYNSNWRIVDVVIPFELVDIRTIDSISITGSLDGITKGYKSDFEAVLEGSAPHGVTWDLSHYTSSDTKILVDGNKATLVIGGDEEYKYVELKATSSFDPAKSASVKVPVRDIEYIKEIKLNDVKFDLASNEITYGKLGDELAKAAVEDSNKLAVMNVYIFQYEDKELSSARVQVYPSLTYKNVVMDASCYYVVDYQVAATPLQNECPNPQFDFNKDKLDEIAVHVNGKKASATVYSYNRYWRTVDVNVPFTAIDYSTYKPVIYELSGGENSSLNPSRIAPGSTLKLSPATRNGYKFAGWYTTDALKTKVTSIVAKDITPVTVYAKWTPVKYSIKYQLAGGKNPKENLKSYTVENNVTLLDPTRKGYTFQGWSDQYGNALTSTNGYYEKLTLSASWSINVYSITANFNGGSIAKGDPLPVSYTVEDKIKMPTLAKDFYKFNGWYRDVYNAKKDIYEPKKVASISKSAEDLEVYAVFTPLKYNITYKLNGGSIARGTVYDKFYTAESTSVVLPTPTKNGMTFKGWYSSLDLAKEHEIKTLSDIVDYNLLSGLPAYNKITLVAVYE